MTVDNTLNVNTISQINKQLRQLDQAASKTSSISPLNVYTQFQIPTAGLIKFAPSQRWVHLKIDKEDPDKKIRKQAAWIYLPGLYQILMSKILNNFDEYSFDVDLFSRHANQLLNIPSGNIENFLYKKIVFLPVYKDSEDEENKTYYNQDNKFTKYTTGAEIFWHGESITNIAAAEIEFNTDRIFRNTNQWMELPYAADEIRSYSFLFATSLDWQLQSAETTKPLYRIFFIPNYNSNTKFNLTQKVLNNLGLDNMSPVFDYITIPINCVVDIDQYKYSPSSSSTIDFYPNFKTNSTDIIPIGRYWNYEKDGLRWFFVDSPYKSELQWERASSNFYRRIISESLSKELVLRYEYLQTNTGTNKTKSVVLTSGTQTQGDYSTFLFTTTDEDIQSYPEVSVILWRHKRKYGESDVIVMFCFIGDTVPAEYVNGPRRDIVNDINSNFGELTPDEDWELIDSAYQTVFRISSSKEFINTNYLRYPQQTNKTISDLFASLCNSNHRVDSEDETGLSSIGYNYANSYQLYKFSNLDYHYTPNDYNNNNIELVIRDKNNPDTANINYISLSDFVDVLSSSADFTPLVGASLSNLVDTQATNGAQDSVEIKNNMLQLYNFDDVSHINKAGVIDGISNNILERDHQINRWYANNQTYIGYENDLVPDALFDASTTPIKQKSITVDETTYNRQGVSVMELYDFKGGNGNTKFVTIGDPNQKIFSIDGSLTRTLVNGVPTLTYDKYTFDWSLMETRVDRNTQDLTAITARIDNLVQLNGLNES